MTTICDGSCLQPITGRLVDASLRTTRVGFFSIKMSTGDLLEDFKRKKQTLEDESGYMLKLCSKLLSLAEKKEHDLNILVELTTKYPKVEDEIVRFNVGGTVFATSRSNIIKKISKPAVKIEATGSGRSSPADEADKLDQVDQYFEPHMLQGLVSGIVEVKLDSTGAIFIDRNPKYFDVILDYLRAAGTGKPFNPGSADLSELHEAAEFYNVTGLIDATSLSKLQADKLIQLIEPKLNLEISKLSLLYRATRDGFAASSFHQRCDNQGKTLTIIKAANTNYVFGGYASVSWDSSDSFRQDRAAFLFSLVNQTNQPILINHEPVTPYSIYCQPSHGPTFGGGHDFHICNNADTCDSSYSNLGRCYKHPSYTYQSTAAQSLLAGSYNFIVSEIEVFSIN